MSLPLLVDLARPSALRIRYLAHGLSNFRTFVSVMLKFEVACKTCVPNLLDREFGALGIDSR